jgi:hypothetical protein
VQEGKDRKTPENGMFSGVFTKKFTEGYVRYANEVKAGRAGYRERPHKSYGKI